MNENDTYDKLARARLELDARQETELGTLRGYMQVVFNWTTDRVSVGDLNGDGELEAITTTGTGVGIDHAYIELGGFRVGKTHSLFASFTDFAGGVMNDDLVPYGGAATNQIVYSFDAGNGFVGAIGLEEGNGDTFTIDSYVPHVVAGVGYAGGWGAVKVVGGYDSVYEEFAVKARLDVKASETVSVFAMGGFKSDDATPNFYGDWAGDWAIWGGASAAVSEKANVNVQLSYDDGDNFAAVANVAYTLVPNLIITPEIAYTDNFDVDGDDQWGAMLRFDRTF